MTWLPHSVENLSGSSFLNGLQRLFYYGFYDLSQVQLSFFESVTHVVPTTLYFPLQDRPAFLLCPPIFRTSSPSIWQTPMRIEWGRGPNRNNGIGRTLRDKRDRGRGGIGDGLP